MSDDTIYRQTAIDALKAMAVPLHLDSACEDIWERDRTLDNAINVMRGLPSAQPVRKTGQWIKRKKGAIGYNCSCCGKSDISNHFDYCPNCGADMRGEQDE